MNSALLVDLARFITLPSLRHLPIPPITVRLIYLLFFWWSTGSSLVLQERFGTEFEAYVVSSTQIKLASLAEIKLPMSLEKLPRSSSILSD